MPSLHSIIPDADAVLALEPEELAGILLLHLADLPANDGKLNRSNFFHNPDDTFRDYPQNTRSAVAQAFLDAWAWLESDGLIVRKASAGHPDWIFISRRGAQMKTREAFDVYRRAGVLPRALIHPSIAGRVARLNPSAQARTTARPALKAPDYADLVANDPNVEPLIVAGQF
jgi:hypothetical protein